MKNVVLEPSTNTHVLESSKAKVVAELSGGIMVISNAKGSVKHGEHGTLVVESNNLIKYTQQEVNPVTRALQNAFD